MRKEHQNGRLQDDIFSLQMVLPRVNHKSCEFGSVMNFLFRAKTSSKQLCVGRHANAPEAIPGQLEL